MGGRGEFLRQQSGKTIVEDVNDFLIMVHVLLLHARILRQRLDKQSLFTRKPLPPHPPAQACINQQ